MTKFQELRKEVRNRIEYEDKYWDSLYEIVKNFGGGFMDFLGLEDNAATDENGNKIGIINIGRNREGRFERCAYWQHDREGRNLYFQLKMNLPSEEGMKSEVSIDVRVALSKPDAYGDEVSVSTSSMHSPILCEMKDGRVDLTPFYEALFQELKNLLDLQSL
ncbi:hypothetical protein QM543_07400 [Pantoea eucrina]|uniref:hypothetical protein n=1 Tax=Pantoea eucrina TaxID=472693 RepID=UPI0024B79ED3|nr:hypothetical protein [Pantoea eucrina]MDJ0023107.1 hypothetical protein [Pantoea eucrina]